MEKQVKFKTVKSLRGYHEYLPGYRAEEIFCYNLWSKERDNYFLDDFKVMGIEKPIDVTSFQIGRKLALLRFTEEYFKEHNIQFDKFNGLPPSRINQYKGYEFGTLWFWAFLIRLLKKHDAALEIFNSKNFYGEFKDLVSKVYKKYPVTTSSLLFDIDLMYPENKFMDYTDNDTADFDHDTQDVWNNEKADEFNKWLIYWCGRATAHDKMRVDHWFETKKSHKQIFAEIQKVAGNPTKFNPRLALFLERLLNNDNLDYFYEKSGFDSKEDLYMAYLGKLEMFDDEAKRSFIKKYLMKGETK